LTRALKNNRFLPGGCYFFKIVWRWVSRSFHVAPYYEARWSGRPSHRPGPSNPAIFVIYGEIFWDLTCSMTRSPVVLEPHVSPRCQGDFLQQFW
jgi:hypothetical protein